MADAGTLSWTNWRGKEETRQINYTLDLRNHEGEPGWAMLVIAANTHLSSTELLTVLEDGGVIRSRSWVKRRLWMFRQPDVSSVGGNKPNKDGKDERAREIMRANPTKSSRQLVRLLGDAGIARGRDWVWRNRCK